MKRRQFVTGATAAGLAGVTASAFPAPALATGNKELRMVTTWPRNSPGLGNAAERLAKRINSMSGGSLVVKVHAAGELVAPFESFDAVSSGVADMYHAWEYYWQAKTKAFAFFASVPFGLTATEMSAWIHHGGGQEIWDKLSSGFNLKPFLAGNTGVQMGGWFNKKIHALEDYRDLKIRMPGLGGEVLRRIGATSVAVPRGEIVPALASDDIDAAEWVGPWNDLALGLHKVAKYYYYPGFHEPGTALCVAVNLKVWEDLASEHKEIVATAAAAENDVVLAEFNARNNDALETLRSEHKVSLRKVPNDVLKAIGEASGQVVSEAGHADSVSRRVYDSFIVFRRKSLAWSKLSDQAYSNARLLRFKYG